MVVSGGNLSVEYDNSVMFSYSPNFIKVTRTATSVTSFTVTVSDVKTAESVSFSFQFSNNETINVDVSRALQVFGDDIEIAVNSPSGQGVSFYVYNIQGSRGTIELFGGKYHIRQWQGYPLTINVLYHQVTEVFQRVDGRDTKLVDLVTTNESEHDLNTNIGVPYPILTVPQYLVYAEGQMYAGENWETDYWSYRITPSCVPSSKSVIYLRWVDVQGLVWYWLFELHEETTTTQESVVYSRLPIDDGNTINEWDSERSKTVKCSAKVGTYNVTKDEYKVLKTIASSAMVDAYDEDADRWYRVRVADGEFTTPSGNYKDFEIVVEFAPKQTQIP